jgi:hypothetical protein
MGRGGGGAVRSGMVPVLVGVVGMEWNGIGTEEKRNRLTESESGSNHSRHQLSMSTINGPLTININHHQ